MFTASTLVLTLALSAGAAKPTVVAGNVAPLAGAAAPVLLTAGPGAIPTAQSRIGERALRTPAWMTDKVARPSALPAMYATLGVLQTLDVYSTRRALNAGGRELNPVMRAPAGNAGVMLAVKALSTAGSIFFAERAWKKNRKGAVILMTVVNGVTAAVVANNLKGAR